MADEKITELETLVVHSNEAGSARWNANTHDYKVVELNTDGDMMLHVRPKDEDLKRLGGQ